MLRIKRPGGEDPGAIAASIRRIWKTVARQVGFAVLMGFALGATPTYAATYYVDDNGSDGNSCSQAQSMSAPKATIQAGIGCLAPGDTLIVRDGTYKTSNTVCGHAAVACLNVSGTSGNWIKIRSENKWGAIVNGNNNAAGYGFLSSGSVSFIEIEGFEISGFSEAGVHLNNSGSDFRILRNWMHHIGRVCSDSTYGKEGVFTRRPRTHVEGNLFHNIGRFLNGENGCSTTAYQYDHGIYAAGNDGGANELRIFNNIFHSITSGWPVHLYPGSLSDIQIRNNTFAFPPGTGSVRGHIIVAANLTNADIASNISYDPNSAFIYYYQGTYSGVTVRNNMVYDASLATSSPSGVTTSGNLTGHPQFVSLNAPYDFRLVKGSPAIDKGATLSPPDIDFVNAARPRGSAHDIGAYEFAEGNSAPAPPSNVRLIK